MLFQLVTYILFMSLSIDFYYLGIFQSLSITREICYFRRKGRKEMSVELRQLSIHDGMDVYEMLQEIPEIENGFVNGCNGRAFEDFKSWLIKSDNTHKGIGLKDWMVPQTSYWLYADGVPVGFAKLRHDLTDKLREEGGHIGYAIRPSCRNKGYGKLLLKLVIEEAGKMGIDKVLITIHSDNTPSLKVAVANGGIVEKSTEVRHYVWIDCTKG
jgi:predicted acetyltransferase